MTPEQKQWLDRGFRRLSSDDDRLCVDRRTGIAALDHIDKLEAEREETMAAHMRMTACVAACAGIPTDKLRPGIVRELIAAARLAHGVVPAGGDGTYKYVDAAPLRALLRELGSE